MIQRAKHCSPKHYSHNHNKNQQGASFVEFNIVALPLICLCLLGMELIYFNQTRLMVTLALNEAMRTCITHHQQPSVTLSAFNTALLPLFAPAGKHASLRAKQTWVHQDFLARHRLPPWQLLHLGPDHRDFTDFAHPLLTQRNGQATIRNTYLLEQHQENIRLGWVNGKGPVSRRDVFEANTAWLQLTYLHQPFTPGVALVIKALLRSDDEYIQRAYQQGLIAIRVEQKALMQSDPQQW